MPELLIELFSEEVPARMQKRASEDLKRLVTDGLKATGLEFTSADAYATPRRLALVVDGLPEKQPDVREERRGPRADAPEKAIAGFKGSLPEGSEIEERETEKGTFLYAVVEKKGTDTVSVLVDLITDTVRKLPWQKSMRWGEGELRYVRPLQSVLCLFNGSPVLGKVELGRGKNLAFGTQVAGHRFMSGGEFAVTSFGDYKSGLLNAKVMLDASDRRAKIGNNLKALADAASLSVRDDPGLLDEVSGLVEWPVVHLGSIDDEFMEVPDEVLITSMRSHQKYFSLLNADGSLAPRFGVVANMEAEDGGKAIVAGNERVLRARLADAKFFWDQDRKASLASKAPSLKGMVFHAKLGTLDEKVDRMQALAVEISAYVQGADKDQVRSAARLAKADLVTDMVGEFPDLQGVMGRYYARHDGESDAVAEAIADHYSPQGPNDRCPSAPVSVCVALADKIDTLVGFWAIDEKPTGSRDPYALRRSALGVIRLIVENELRVPMLAVFAQSAALYGSTSDDFDGPDLLGFFADRMKVHLREQGVRHDLISSIFALSDEDDLVRLLARVDALKDFVVSDDGANLLTAYKRAANILAIEEKKDDASYDAVADRGLFAEDEETSMAEALEQSLARAETAIEAENFAAAMGALSELRGPVDTFFDVVTVNAEDAALRVNRLKLLSEIRTTMNRVADFSQIEG
jgi:glycyl-tRNA synthetase beta chain